MQTDPASLLRRSKFLRRSLPYSDKQTRNQHTPGPVCWCLTASLDIAIQEPPHCLPFRLATRPLDATSHVGVHHLRLVYFGGHTLDGQAFADALVGAGPIYLLEVSLFMVGFLVVAISPSFGRLSGRACHPGSRCRGNLPGGRRGHRRYLPARQARPERWGSLALCSGWHFLLGPLLGGIILAPATWGVGFSCMYLPIAIALLYSSWRRGFFPPRISPNGSPLITWA